MSFEGRLKIEDIVVYFDYAYNTTKHDLECEYWTAYNNAGHEIAIPSAELSEEIENEIKSFLSRQVVSDFIVTDRGDESFDYYKDNVFRKGG